MVCVFMFFTTVMRKRKYGHIQPQDKIEDFMIEDNENYYDAKYNLALGLFENKN